MEELLTRDLADAQVEAPKGAVEPIVAYMVILYEHGLGSAEAIQFFKEHEHDDLFKRRAKAAELLYRHKARILEELGKLDDLSGATEEAVSA